MSVWEDLTVCDFLDIIGSWKLVGWGKNGVQGTNLLDRIISVLGCLKLVQNSYFRSRPAIFQFSRALVVGTHLKYLSFRGEIRKISVFLVGKSALSWDMMSLSMDFDPLVFDFSCWRFFLSIINTFSSYLHNNNP